MNLKKKIAVWRRILRNSVEETKKKRKSRRRERNKKK